MRCAAFTPMRASSPCCAPRRCTPCRDLARAARTIGGLRCSNRSKMAFERHLVVLPLSNILPMKRVPDSIKQTLRYKRIISSIGEVGIVEPLVVARQQDDNEPYM